MQKKTRMCLDYSFEREYPYTFKIHANKVIIGNGQELVSFDSAGKEISRVSLPIKFLKGNTFLDFLPLSDTSYLVTINSELYQVSPRTQTLLTRNFGELIRGEPPIIVTNFQESDDASNVFNGLKIYDLRSGSITKYPTDKNLGTYNFEVLDKNIALTTPDKAFCILPFDTTKSIKNFEIPFNDFYSFLGINQNHFVFLTRDYNKKKDHLHFYDVDMKFVKECVLNVSYNDLSNVVQKDDNFSMEAPFGNFYSFDRDSKTIFVFRHTKKNGICYFPIHDRLEVLNK